MFQNTVQQVAPLKKGDRVWVVAPSSESAPNLVSDGIAVLKSWGLEVLVGAHVGKSWGSFSAIDSARAEDLQLALNDTEAKAIFCLRGGYGLGRIVQDLDFQPLFLAPKWIIGFSDATILHAALNKRGYFGVHGPMVAQLGKSEYVASVEHLKCILFGKVSKLSYALMGNPKSNSGSEIQGRLLGGNLSLLAFTVGSDLLLQSEGAILFIEEVGEKLYRIDRMVWQLKNAGLFQSVKAIVLGHFTNCESDRFPLSVIEIFQQAAPHVPLFWGLQAGHEPPNYPLILGISASIKFDELNSCSINQNILPNQLITS